MKDVKIHTCPTCGGNLIVNIERQMYECPFCGVTFDYDYFREENVLGIAAQALKNNEFTSADRAYDFMLEKEPDNFEALRGKALIAMNMPKIDNICRLDILSKINYESACKEIDRAIGSSKPQDREYFTVMKDIVDAGNDYIGEKAQLETQKTEKSRSQDRLNEFVEEKDAIPVYSSANTRPKKTVILTIFGYVICCLLIVLVFMYSNRNPYSEAEDLSKYETNHTEVDEGRTKYNNYSSNGIDNLFKDLSNYEKYQEALEREEQRKINYDEWEKNHKPVYTNLIWILGFATVIFALIIFILFKWGKNIDAEITKSHAKMNEQIDKIKNHEKRIAELKDRIDQDYKRLCELHPDRP